MRGRRPITKAADPRRPTNGDLEMSMLLALARTRHPSEIRERVRALADNGLNWDRLYELAWRHRLSPLIYRSLERCRISIPPNIRKDLDGDRTDVVLQSLAYTQELLRIHSAFLAEKIEYVVLKGPVLGVTLYQDLGLRPFGDLDILVRLENILRAKELLVGLGYRPDPPMSPKREQAYISSQSAYEFFQDEKGFKAELHTALVHRRFEFHHDIDQIWSRTSRATVGNVEVGVLGTEDLLLFLCVHGAKHAWRQLIWLCDVAELIGSQPMIDWTRLIAEAEQKNCARMLYLGLYLAREWLGTSLPAYVEDRIQLEEATFIKLASHIRERATAREETRERLRAELHFHMLVREAPRDKWGQVVEKVGDRVRNNFQNFSLSIRPSDADRAFISLPGALAPLYLIVRPIRFLWTILSGGSHGRRSDV